MSLYVGANYHPHDWPEERWPEDIRLMKEADFTTVRLGHLCWDSYEPEEGVYTFEWFDRVMDLFEEAGIQVVLDVSMRPAPVWVHKLCPGCDIYGKSGTKQESLRRYMEDIADEAYQFYALRFAKTIVSRYKDHPALFAFGLCNEIGDGYISHSEYARRRFAQWLKHKYKTVDNLNRAWAGQRWSRKLTSFDDAVIPENDLAVGPPEAWLDMRRFFSDGISDFFLKLKNVVEENGPGILHSSNHYAEKDHLGFDYLKICDELGTYPGMRFYPGYGISDKFHFLMSIYQQRLAETGMPMWCLEFQSGSRQIPDGPDGAIRMFALLCLLNRCQMILGWTWRSMLGGEEQFLHGILAHDGRKTRKYEEYRRIASDFKKLEEYAFPYLPEPEVGVSWHYGSFWENQYNQSEFLMPYRDVMTEVQKLFYQQNRDYNTVDLRNLKGSYKLLLIPNQIMMEPEMAETVRSYVRDGGTVIMTGNSAVVDETGKVFGVPRPGYLTDVFGIQIGGYYRTNMDWTFGEESEIYDSHGEKREYLTVVREGESCRIAPDCYEVILPKGAQVWAEFAGKDFPAVTVNTYGKGRAYYTASETNGEMLGWLMGQIAEEIGLSPAPEVPEGVQARWIDQGQFFAVNTTRMKKEISLKGRARGVLSGLIFQDHAVLEPYDGELFVMAEDGAERQTD